MLNRWAGIIAIGFMLVANAALFVRDFLPGWSAGDPPNSRVMNLRVGQESNTQLGIFDVSGRRLGYTWAHCKHVEELYFVRHRTVLQDLPVSLPADVGMIRIDVDLVYTDDSRLDNLRVKILGLGVQARFDGEYLPPDDFACKWQVGEQRGELLIPGSLTSGLGDAVRPFESLTELSVGRSWRMEIINPLAVLMPDLGAKDMATESTIATVTRIETVEHMDQSVDAFVIEADRMRAWVTPAGKIIRQEYDMPLVGTLVLVEEKYDEDVRDDMLIRAMKN